MQCTREMKGKGNAKGGNPMARVNHFDLIGVEEYSRWVFGAFNIANRPTHAVPTEKHLKRF